MPVDFKLYLITDRKQTRVPLAEAVGRALRSGVRAVQLREKDLPLRELLALGRDVRSITAEFNAKLFVNDRVDAAVSIGADGVHLGQQSMPVSAVRRIVGQDMMIGVSTHTVYEARDAEAGGADFITFGPVFFTPSKVQYGAPVGLQTLTMVKQHVHLPVFGLGGIKPGDLRTVLSAGADGVAVISAILAADDIQMASRNIFDAMQILR